MRWNRSILGVATLISLTLLTAAAATATSPDICPTVTAGAIGEMLATLKALDDYFPPVSSVDADYLRHQYMDALSDRRSDVPNGRPADHLAALLTRSDFFAWTFHDRIKRVDSRLEEIQKLPASANAALRIAMAAGDLPDISDVEAAWMSYAASNASNDMTGKQYGRLSLAIRALMPKIGEYISCWARDAGAKN